MTSPLVIWTDVRAAESHPDFKPLTLVHDPADLARARVAFGQPPVDALLASTTLRWVHVSSAGYTRYDKPEILAHLKSHNIAFTNSSSVFADPCAQHLLAMMLALSRQLPACAKRQHPDRSWPRGDARDPMRILTGQSAILYGYGAIAARLVELLTPFRMDLLAVRRHPRGDESVPTVTPEAADAQLPRFDHIVNILPANDDTRHFFDAPRLARAKPGAWFYNIGRGATVDQPALLAALQSGRLGAAYLDVTTPEPLPPEDPLWTAPNCWITPHIGGGFQHAQDEVLRHFLENLTRFEKQQPMRDRIV